MSAADDRLLADVRREWAALGLDGSLVARDLATGRQLGFGVDEPWPLASVVKLPLALVAYDAFERGDLARDRPFDVDPGSATSGPTGVALFRHPARVAAEDLVQLALAVSDNAATDLLLDHLGTAAVDRRLSELGFPDLVVRHEMRAIYGTDDAVGRVGLGLTAGGGTPGGGHLVPELDPHRANVGTARALLDLLARVWADEVSTPRACADLRAALGRQPTRHRLAAELASDAVTVRSKTGTFLDLRHEVGVVETPTHRIAVAALTRSGVPANVQIEADLAIGHAARELVDHLRTT
ncbi:serine hydrolase [Nocardioides zeae]|uniref:Serine hydrolase n=1 Tax=Nocardioides imazamoxiresistens TaxID=3231893 RepID=A0ABU3PZN9_9ACTN|nr:serine hydrolase [Nocardioides zeae]MDT9594716.1 serine hydrolase [Nocardioides zeae]